MKKLVEIDEVKGRMQDASNALQVRWNVLLFFIAVKLFLLFARKIFT